MTTESKTPEQASTEFLAAEAAAQDNFTVDEEGLEVAPKPGVEVVQRAGEHNISVGMETSIITGESQSGLIDEFRGAMTAYEVTSAGYLRVFDIRTGDASLVNREMLLAQLRKTCNDENDSEWFGKRIFSARRSDVINWRKPGTLKCWLHADHVMRPVCDELGLPVCRKATMYSEFDVNNHVRNRHSREYAQLEERRERLEREEDRQAQRDMMRAIQRMSDAPPTVVVPQISPVDYTDEVLQVGKCHEPNCAFESQAKRADYRKSSLVKHLKSIHPAKPIAHDVDNDESVTDFKS